MVFVGKIMLEDGYFLTDILTDSRKQRASHTRLILDRKNIDITRLARTMAELTPDKQNTDCLDLQKQWLDYFQTKTPH